MRMPMDRLSMAIAMAIPRCLYQYEYIVSQDKSVAKVSELLTRVTGSDSSRTRVTFVGDSRLDSNFAL